MFRAYDKERTFLFYVQLFCEPSVLIHDVAELLTSQMAKGLLKVADLAITRSLQGKQDYPPHFAWVDMS